MQTYKLPNAAASVLTISTTALTLQDAIQTAAGASVDLTGLDSVDISVTANDISFLTDGNTPTAANGILIGQSNASKEISLRGVNLTNVKMIRAGGTDATVRVQVGKSNIR